MNCDYNKVVVMFVYSFGIVLMAAVTAAAAEDECAKLNEACDFFPPINKNCCKGMACVMSLDELAKKDESLKGECVIDSDVPLCRKRGQPCGNNTTPATSSMLQLSASTTCCDHMECDEFSRKCRVRGSLECGKEGQQCGIIVDDSNPLVDDYQNDLLASYSFCCPGLECGALNGCYEPPKIECRKEGESCRLIACCGGLNCNPIENDHTGEEQYQCQKKTCNKSGTCSTLGGSGCCDSHYCNPHWGVVGLCELRN